ncbi:hypothetical protein [Crassaminicella indica]|uniref:Uncharacterized protein n=1 Tax=Crassaminicella indica TaxID=2855394 RepID=A0ABX8RDN5_9CLOT|nr:hypothetical protein [Crassaminicella indica]QXM06534.1 hypothetical protein KVH43_01940 [Crassaminicella indica]
MKKTKILKIATYTSGSITILLILAYILKDFMFHAFLKITSQNVSSIEIIGASDGPTAIFLAPKIGGISLKILIFIFGVITAILVLLKKVSKKNY